MKKSSLAILLVLLFLWLSPAAAAPALTMSATIGFAGFYKIGEWVPVRVELSNEGADLNGEVQVEGVTENGLRTLYSRPISLPARSHKALFLYTLYTGFVRDIEVRLVQGQEVVAEKKASADPVADGTYLVGVVAEEPYPSVSVSAIMPPANRRAVRVARLSLDELPPRVQALRSLDAIVLSNVSTGNLSREQREALATWVNMGGQLVVATGPSWQKTAEGVADLLPVQVSGVRTLERIPELERLGESPIRTPGPFVAATSVPQAGAEVLAGQGDLPLIAERRLGAGRVDFLALDLALEPLNGWTGTGAVWQRLLVASPSSVTPEAKVRRGNPSGGPPVTSALSNIPAMDLPSAKWLGLFLGAYILCIGPLNYLVLRRLDRREWAWLTVPLLTLLFSAGAYFIGFQAKGGDVIVSTISIQRVYADGRPAAVESYFGLFSPGRRTYDVVLPGDSLVSSMPAWGPWSAPGNAPAPLKVQQGDTVVLRDVNVDMWSMRAFMVEQPGVGDYRPLQANLHVEGNRLVGTVANVDSRSLEDAVLVLGNSVNRLGTLAAGESRSVELEIQKSANPQNDQWMPMSMRVLGQGPFVGNGPPPPPDRVRVRRQNLLDYVFGYGKGGPPEAAATSGTLQLLAWRSDDPLELEVKGLTMARTSTVLVLSELPVSFGRQQISVPPGFMPRTVVESDARNFNTTPFGFFLGDGSAVFQFQLPPGTERMKIEELALHFDLLNRGAPGSAEAEMKVYDWSRKDWVEIKDLTPGDSLSLEHPERYVGEGGAIQLKLGRAGSGSPLEVTQLDFSVKGRL